MIDDVTTMRGSLAEAADASAIRVPCLTILWHSDPTRIGEWAPLEAQSHLSRLEPEFTAPGAAEPALRRPLSDPNLSRQPARIVLGESCVTLSPVEGGSEIHIAGERLTSPRSIDFDELEVGVPVEIARRVVLLLHRRAVPTSAGDDMQLVGASEQMGLLRKQILQVADLEVPVLLRGPTGSGKELVARAIHAHSTRRARPMLAVNLVTLPATTAASALFGHAKGAFTGADAPHQGFFAKAHQSTLFLDEIAEASTEIQAMLLRVLEVGEIQALGSTKSEKVDVRVLAATDAALAALIAEQRFREPLLHRLAGFQIEVPALKTRRDDIARLLLYFLREELALVGETARLHQADTAAPLWLPSDLMARLVRYDWPGNVRELRNVARHMVISNRGCPRVADDDFLKSLCNDRGTEAGQGLNAANASTEGEAKRELRKERPADIDDERLIATLAKHAWKTGAAANELQVSRTTLYAMMERCEGLRKAKDLSAEELRAGLEELAGDLEALSARFRVSKRGLQLRIKELGLGSS